MSEGPPTHALPPLRVTTSIAKGDPTIAALQTRRARQLQGESAVASPSARDNAPAGTPTAAPQALPSQRDDLVGDIMADYRVAAPAPAPVPAQAPAPTAAKPAKPVESKPAGTATIGQLAAAMGIQMEGAAPAQRVVDEEEMMEVNELNPGAFLKAHAPKPLSKQGLIAAALSRLPKPQ